MNWKTAPFIAQARVLSSLGPLHPLALASDHSLLPMYWQHVHPVTGISSVTEMNHSKKKLLNNGLSTSFQMPPGVIGSA